MDKLIKSMLERGLESPDAIGVRATSVERAAEYLRYGIPFSKYPRYGDAIAFCPYCDREQFEGIRKINEQLRLVSQEDKTEYGTKNQIEDNHKDYGKFNAINGSREARILTYNYESNFEPGELENPQFIEELSKKTGLSKKQIGRLLRNMDSREGVQFALVHKVLEDFKVFADDPIDVLFLSNGIKRLPVKYISGIKVYTEKELKELNYDYEQLS